MPYMQSKRMDVKISPFSRASANLTAQGFDACWPLLQLPIQLCRCDVLTVFFLMKIYCFFKFGRFSPCKSKKRKDQKTLQTKETEGTVSLPQFAHSSAALIQTFWRNILKPKLYPPLRPKLLSTLLATLFYARRKVVYHWCHPVRMLNGSRQNESTQDGVRRTIP